MRVFARLFIGEELSTSRPPSFCPEPIAKVNPSLAFVLVLRSSRDVFRKCPAFGISDPLLLSLQVQRLSKRASSFKGEISSALSRNGPGTQPVPPADPTFPAVYSLRVSWNIVGPLSRF